MSDTYSTGQLQSYAATAATAHGVPVAFFQQLISDESSWNPAAKSNYLTSSGYPTGIAQITTGTAQTLGIDPNNPLQSLDASAGYLQSLFQKTGSWMGAAKAYGTTTGAGSKNIPGLEAALSGSGNINDTLSGIASAMSGGLSNWAGGSTSDPNAFGFNLPSVERITAIVIGVILIGIALVFLLSETKTGQTIISTGKTAAKAAIVA